MKRLRIAATFNHGTSNAHYRAIVPMEEMVRRGHQVLLGSREGSFAKLVMETRPEWDAVLMQQAVHRDDLGAVRRLRELGVAVVWDTDDDIRAVPRSSRSYTRMGGRRGVKETFARSVEIARTAHLMTTPSAHLAEIYRAEGVEHVAVIENYLAPAAVRDLRRPRHAGVVIGIVAAGEHERDIKRLKLGKALAKLLAAQGDVRVVAIGCDLGIKDPRYTWIQRVPFEQLQRHLATFDIGLAPLVDGQLARSRSNVKLKEYAAAGAMWLASPMASYVGMGEAQGGLLVGEGDWLATLTAVVQDPERRAELKRAARDWAAGETITAGGKVWERELRAAVGRAGGG